MKPNLGSEIHDAIPRMVDDVDIEIVKSEKKQHVCSKQGYNVVSILAGEACHFCKEVV